MKASSVFLFLAKWFVVFFLLLSLPLKMGWDKHYSHYYSFFCESIFKEKHIVWKNQFEEKGREMDIYMEVKDKKEIAERAKNWRKVSSKKPRYTKSVHASWKVGLLPAIMLLALILATTTSHRKKLLMLLIGLVAIHLFWAFFITLKINYMEALLVTKKPDSLFLQLFEKNIGYRYFVPISIYGLLLLLFDYKKIRALNFG